MEWQLSKLLTIGPHVNPRLSLNWKEMQVSTGATTAQRGRNCEYAVP